MIIITQTYYNLSEMLQLRLGLPKNKPTRALGSKLPNR